MWAGKAAECDIDVGRAEQWHRQSEADAGKNRGGVRACWEGLSKLVKLQESKTPNFNTWSFSPQEHSAAEALNHKLRRQLRDYQAPDITEYVHVKDKYKKLKQSIHTWERKVGIAEVKCYFYLVSPQ